MWYYYEKKEEKTDLNDVEERAENQLENVSAIRWKTNEIIIDYWEGYNTRFSMGRIMGKLIC